jgi:predicted O-methyltransferase YrrM
VALLRADDPPGQRALLDAVVAESRRTGCRRLQRRVRRDMRSVAGALGDQAQRLRPLPLVPKLYVTEAQAVRGIATPPEGGAILWALTRVLRPRSVVEIGTGHGYGALYIGSALRANGAGRLATLDGIDVRVRLAREALQRFELAATVEVVSGEFARTVPDTLARLAPVDLLFSDGAKVPADTRAEFIRALQSMPAGGHMLFDDIDFSADITRVWRDIGAHERVAAVATLRGRWGLLTIRADAGVRGDTRAGGAVRRA